MFQSGSTSEIEEFATIAYEVTFPDGTTIFNTGERGDALYFIFEGAVKIHRASAELAIRRTGECIGEMALLNDKPRIASAVIQGKTQLLKIDREDFQRVMQRKGGLPYHIMKMLADKLREDTEARVEAARTEERIKHELKRAREIQRAMLPEKEPKLDWLEISASFLTAEEMGGDYYDYLQLSPTTFGIVIGDATGHEIPAGILVAMAKSCLHTLIRIDASVESVMQRMNEMVYETMKTMKRKLLMSFCYVILDTTNSTLTFSSAGHPPPYHYRQRIGKLDTLESFAYPLGVRRNIVYQAQKVQFQPGDIFIFYSDGIVEVENDKKEPFGYERIEQTIAESAPKIANVEELKSAILQKTYTYCHNLSFTDDATLVVLKILP